MVHIVLKRKENHMIRQYFCEKKAGIINFYLNYAVCWALTTNVAGFLLGSKYVYHPFLLERDKQHNYSLLQNILTILTDILDINLKL